MTKRGNCRAGEGENAQAEHWLPYLKDKLGLVNALSYPRRADSSRLTKQVFKLVNFMVVGKKKGWSGQ